jgi:hypothetical protein
MPILINYVGQTKKTLTGRLAEGVRYYLAGDYPEADADHYLKGIRKTLTKPPIQEFLSDSVVPKIFDRAGD